LHPFSVPGAFCDIENGKFEFFVGDESFICGVSAARLLSDEVNRAIERNEMSFQIEIESSEIVFDVLRIALGRPIYVTKHRASSYLSISKQLGIRDLSDLCESFLRPDFSVSDFGSIRLSHSDITELFSGRPNDVISSVVALSAVEVSHLIELGLLGCLSPTDSFDFVLHYIVRTGFHSVFILNQIKLDVLAPSSFCRLCETIPLHLWTVWMQLGLRSFLRQSETGLFSTAEQTVSVESSFESSFDSMLSNR
jgi:hypothetical protein